MLFERSSIVDEWLSTVSVIELPHRLTRARSSIAKIVIFKLTDSLMSSCGPTVPLRISKFPYLLSAPTGCGIIAVAAIKLPERLLRDARPIIKIRIPEFSNLLARS